MAGIINIDNGSNGTDIPSLVSCAALRQGSYVMLNGRPCRLVEMPKVTLIAEDLFTGNTYQDECKMVQMINIPEVISEYYRVVEILNSEDKSFLSVKSFEGDKLRDDIEVPQSDLGCRIQEEMKKKGQEVYCTVLFSCGEQRVVSVNSFPEFPDFYRLPFEMNEKIFSFLGNSDLQNVRLVSKTWNWVLPITSLVRLQSVKITQHNGILLKLSLSKSYSFNQTKIRQLFRLTDVPKELLATLRELDMQEVVSQLDLNWILENCNKLESINMEYPTAQMMGSVPELIFRNEHSLETISLWDFYWYNSEEDAFDCAMLENCQILLNLELFARHIQNIEMIPQGIRCLKLDNVHVEKIEWVSKHLLHLRTFRFDVEHDHRNYHSKNNKMTVDHFKSLVNMPRLEQLDVNFITLDKWAMGENELTSPCQTVRELEDLCKLTKGINAEADTWGMSCTLEVLIDRDIFKGFEQ